MVNFQPHRFSALPAALGTRPAGADLSGNSCHQATDSADHVRERRADAGHLRYATGRHAVSSFDGSFPADLRRDHLLRDRFPATASHRRPPGALQLHERATIWYSRDPEQRLLPGDCQNVIVLSDEFYREILSHPIPTDLEAARALSSSPAALDLFTWLSYRCFTARGRERVPLFGDFGLVSQLGSADYARPRKFREKSEGWLNLVRAMWPECPASIDSTGKGLFVDRANAVLPGGGETGYVRK